MRIRSLAALAAFSLPISACGQAPPAKDSITVMSALPLFGAQGEIGAVLNGPDRRAQIIRALEREYRAVPVDHLDAKTLSPASVLFLAQPRGLSGQELVALDDWVRRGGRVLVFADPLLLWPSDLPLGDPRRAPPVTLLDPLFAHWGLTLDSPSLDTEIASASLDGAPVSIVGAGTWQAAGKNCAILDAGIVADCSIGKGQAILVADADLLDERLWRTSGRDNAGAVMAVVRRVARKSEPHPPKGGT